MPASREQPFDGNARWRWRKTLRQLRAYKSKIFAGIYFGRIRTGLRQFAVHQNVCEHTQQQCWALPAIEKIVKKVGAAVTAAGNQSPKFGKIKTLRTKAELVFFIKNNYRRKGICQYLTVLYPFSFYSIHLVPISKPFILPIMAWRMVWHNQTFQELYGIVPDFSGLALPAACRALTGKILKITQLPMALPTTM